MLMITVLYIFFIGMVVSDIQRYDNGYEADFRVINKGRLYPILMYFKNIDFKECSLNCIKYLDCVSFNFNFDTKECELADEDFDEYEADTDALYWLNFGTPQKVDGGFSDWMNGSCNTKCGGGVRSQFRTCTNPEPKFGGDKCIGKMSRTIVCNNHPCPIHGGLSNWVSVGKCSKACDWGFKEEKRTCTQPTPQYGGNDCTGETSRQVKCREKLCPVNGQWTSWTPTSQCSKSCNGGQLTQERSCTDPSPQHGGADCTGDNTRTASCNTHCCSRRTTIGTCCVIPFKLLYVTWNGCTTLFNRCRDIHGNMEDCA